MKSWCESKSLAPCVPMATFAVQVGDRDTGRAKPVESQVSEHVCSTRNLCLHPARRRRLAETFAPSTPTVMVVEHSAALGFAMQELAKMVQILVLVRAAMKSTVCALILNATVHSLQKEEIVAKTTVGRTPVTGLVEVQVVVVRTTNW